MGNDIIHIQLADTERVAQPIGEQLYDENQHDYIDLDVSDDDQ